MGGFFLAIYRKGVERMPSSLSKEELYVKRDHIMKEQQELVKALEPELELRHEVENGEPLLVMLIGDLHIGSDSTDYKELEKLKDFILNEDELVIDVDEHGEPIKVKTSHIRIIFLGDEIEGVNNRYLTTNMTGLTMHLQEQIEYFRDRILKPLADAGKVIGMVSHYWGHPGWAYDATTIDPWSIIADACNVKLIYNGGRVKFVFPDGQESSLEVRHNPTASSEHDPLHGARKELLKESEPERPQGGANAHIHRMAVGKEHHAGSAYPIYMVSSATIKSVNNELPKDKFGIKLGYTNSIGSGQTSVLITNPVGKYRRRSKELVHTPLPTARHAKVAQEGLTLLNELERQNLTTELKERILYEFGREPNISLVEDGSVEAAEVVERLPNRLKTKKDVSPEVSNREAVFSKLRFNIETELPILLNFIANVRVGANPQTDGFREVDRFQRDYVINNPHAVVLYLRNLLDESAGYLPNRRQVLDKLSRFVGRSGDKGLALLADENLRKEEWKFGKDGVAPASHVSREANIPLIHDLSRLELFVGPKAAMADASLLYTIAVLDKLGKHGSYSKPTFGLKRNYDLYMHQKPGIVVGGHTQNSGTEMFNDWSNPETKHPALIAPGWWAKSVDTMGKGNVRPGALPGQGVVLFPQTKKEDYLVFPTSNVEESRLMFDAFMLLVGLEKLGLVESVQAEK
jgi:hypothetical protein